MRARPGKRDKADEKVTDLLYQCYRAVERKQPAEEIFARVAGRYMDIANALGLENGMQKVLEDTFAEIVRQKSPDFTASRGEYLNAFLLARYLGWDFIDAKDYVKFDRQGVFASEWTNEILAGGAARARVRRVARLLRLPAQWRNPHLLARRKRHFRRPLWLARRKRKFTKTGRTFQAF